MPYINKAVIMGHCGKDPEFKSLPSGMTVANVNVATSKTIKGEKKTEWHRLVIFDKKAEYIRPHLKKGDLVYVEGEIQTREWTDRDGKKRYQTEIIVQEIKLFKFAEQRTEQSPAKSTKQSSPQSYDEPEENDLPF